MTTGSQPAPVSDSGSADAADAADAAETAADAADADVAAETADGEMGRYDSPLTVVMVNNTNDELSKQYEAIGESAEDNRWTRLYKEKLNIDIEYMWIAKPDAYDEKFNIMMASGALPDIMRVNAVQFKQLLDADQLADLTGVYDSYMDADYKAITDEDPFMLKLSVFGGKLMGLPQAPTFPYSNTHSLWIRSDWLEKLGLNPPSTMDELIDTARKFVQAKPDGADTYGIALSKDSLGNLRGADEAPGFRGLANGYHAYPNTWIQGAGGKLMNGSIAPEIKTVLSVMNGLYQEGVLSKEFAVKDKTTYYQDLVAGKVGIAYDWLGLGLNVNELKTLKPDAELKAYPLPSADDSPARPQTRAVIDYWYVASKNFSHPEAMIKMANLHIATLITSLAAEMSPDGKTPNSEYYGAPPEASSAFEMVNFWFSLTPDQNAQRVYIKDAAEKRDSSAVSKNDMPIYANLVAYDEGDLSQWGWNRTFGGPNGGSENVNVYKNDNRAMVDEYFGLPTDTMAEREATLDQLQIETFTKIVMGESPVDEFDAFASKWLSLGGQAITDEVNEWYAANK
ncbi:MAG: extracellular solute-binding protein [Clostridiales bacterium]|nr:extracellular solute-binding protein [Clostridiales bacterium]